MESLHPCGWVAISVTFINPVSGKVKDGLRWVVVPYLSNCQFQRLAPVDKSVNCTVLLKVLSNESGVKIKSAIGDGSTRISLGNVSEVKQPIGEVMAALTV